MRCGRCGAEIMLGSAQCAKCGASVLDASTSGEPGKRSMLSPREAEPSTASPAPPPPPPPSPRPSAGPPRSGLGAPPPPPLVAQQTDASASRAERRRAQAVARAAQPVHTRRGCFGCLAPLLVVVVVGVAGAFIVRSIADDVGEALHTGERLAGPAVVLDERIRFELRRSDTGVHRMSLPTSGPVTITVQAVDDFDPKIRVVEIGGPELGSDDDSGGGHDSLLALQLAEGRDYEIEVTEFSGDGGAYILLVRPGEVGPLDTGTRVDGPPVVLGQVLAFAIGEDQIGVHPFVALASEPVAVRVNEVGDFDPEVTVVEVGGAALGTDDDSGGGHDALLNVEVVEGRTYEIRVEEFGDDAGSYELLLASGSIDGSAVGRGEEVDGEVDDGQTSRHPFTGPGGEITVRVLGDDGFDPVLTIRAEGGAVLGTNDDADGLDSLLTVTVQPDTDVTIEVKGFGGRGGRYAIVVE